MLQETTVETGKKSTTMGQHVWVTIVIMWIEIG